MNVSQWKKAAAVFGFALALTVPALSDEPCAGGKHSDCQNCKAKAAVSQPAALPSGIDKADFDLSVDPGENFYHYAIGGWQKANPIPGDQARWGTFNILADNNTKILHEILEQAAKEPQSDLEKSLGKFYASGMNEAAIEAQGLKPIEEDLDRIDQIKNLEDLQTEIAKLHRMGLVPYFCLEGAQDDKDSSRMIATVWQSGLGLPERDYYLRTDKKSAELRKQYVDFIAKMLQKTGYNSSKAQVAAKKIMALETKLAKYSLPAAEMRDPEKMYNLLPQDKVKALTPAFNWETYCSILGIETPAEINVTGPDYLKSVCRELKKTSIDDHKLYLRWKVISSAAPYLTKDLEKCSFDFYSKTLRGTKAMKPRWKRVTETVSGCMDQGLGELYVKRAFSPEAKKKVLEMIDNIKAFMAQDIPQLPCMSETTKQAALKKLASFRAKIGYPDAPRDYTALNAKIGDSYYGNVAAARSFEKKRGLDKIGKPVDKNEWYMPPQMVNAYYQPTDNEIVFPAGILQPPFFDPNRDDAANYGGIGMVIGHEISHGFDDQGAQYDGDGNLRNWWTQEDLAKFQELTKAVDEQFSSYESAGQHLNGKLVLGESMADLSGLALAWGAYQRSLNGGEGKVIDGLTPAQRFFLSYAKIWAMNISPEMLKLQVNTDPHPPAEWRVNGVVSGMPEFFKAFNVKEGQPMRRPADKRNKIW